MQPRSAVSYEWNRSCPLSTYATGVSLHSHTSHSVESLAFIHALFLKHATMRPLFAYYEKLCRDRHHLTLDFESAHWRPPLVPRMAFDLEWQQIRSRGLHALVSITDHDDMQAPLLLRTMRSARNIPVSLEWTVPFGATAFHLGVHNLPTAQGPAWMERFARYTASPHEEDLRDLLSGLHADPQILVVLNHPLWDLYNIGEAAHLRELRCFLEKHGGCIHALELNGLRHARENQAVVALAQQWKQLLISGGDRHGLEANANINLTDASTFTDFVHEIRVERRSQVLFMEQYRRPWEERLLESTLDAIVDHPEFTQGWQRWDERAFHPDTDGVQRPLSELWASGKAPLPLRMAIGLVRLSRYATVSRAIRWMLPREPVDSLAAVDMEIA